MSKESSSGGGGLTLLVIAFVVLKLTGEIDWSWWWVLSPIWIPMAIVGLCYFVVLICLILDRYF